MFIFFKKKIKSYLGIDIGTSSVKLVQLGISQKRLTLETYGYLETYGSLELINQTIQSSSLKLLESEVIRLLKKIMLRAKVSTQDAIMSVPVFSTFSAIMELPMMPEEELKSAISFEARQYIPVPLSEVILGWIPMSRKTTSPQEGLGAKPIEKIEILIVAMPKEIAHKYSNVAQLAGLRLKALETESIASARSLLGNDKSPTIILDIGARNTNISIIDKGFVVMNRGLDTSGNELTRVLSSSLNIDYQRAEVLKRKTGLKSSNSAKQISEIMYPVIDIITTETKRIIDIYFHRTSRRIEKIILAGGSAKLPGLEEYFKEKFNLPVSLANPWSRIIYPEILKSALMDIAPSFSVAVGLAMRELQKGE